MSAFEQFDRDPALTAGLKALRPDQRAYYDHLLRAWNVPRFRWWDGCPAFERRALEKTRTNRP